MELIGIRDKALHLCRHLCSNHALAQGPITHLAFIINHFLQTLAFILQPSSFSLSPCSSIYENTPLVVHTLTGFDFFRLR